MENLKKTIRFKKGDNDFIRCLRERVRDYFHDNNLSTRADSRFYLKGILLFSSYLLTYLLALLYGNNLYVLMLCYAVMGPLAFLAGINTGHDAVHGAISDKSSVNKAFMLVFDVLGLNSFMWRNRHIYAHHRYQNVIHLDSDIPVLPFLRLFPKYPPTALQRYQHLYMPLIYLLYTAHWVMRRDFLDFLSTRIGSYYTHYHWSEIVKLILFKSLYALYIFVVPVLVLDHSAGIIFLAFLLLSAFASISVALILVSSHVGINLLFPEPDEDGYLPNTWAAHQLLTTSDFATGNPVINTLFGGFNHHTFHHFFPTICHVHYPGLTPILQQTAREYGLPYHYEKSLLSSIRSHWKLLKVRATETPAIQPVHG
ncbi:MAG: fatty acid desaturase [Cyclobacteriaceae bacterium]|nr:fatty acid desaturase [Cyclobacteriaceae bacterium]